MEGGRGGGSLVRIAVVAVRMGVRNARIPDETPQGTTEMPEPVC